MALKVGEADGDNEGNDNEDTDKGPWAISWRRSTECSRRSTLASLQHRCAQRPPGGRLLGSLFGLLLFAVGCRGPDSYRPLVRHPGSISPTVGPLASWLRSRTSVRHCVLRRPSHPHRWFGAAEGSCSQAHLARDARHPSGRVLLRAPSVAGRHGPLRERLTCRFYRD